MYTSYLYSVHCCLLSDEVYCKDISAATSPTVWKSSNIPVIIVVSVVVLGAISLLCFGLCKLTSKVKKFNSLYSEELCHSDSDSQQLAQRPPPPHPLLIHRAALEGDLRPSCPPLPPPPTSKTAQLGFPPPPPPYSPPRPLDAPPSYAALSYQRS